jgi:hypothetical protein
MGIFSTVVLAAIERAFKAPDRLLVQCGGALEWNLLRNKVTPQKGGHSEVA